MRFPTGGGTVVDEVTVTSIPNATWKIWFEAMVLFAALISWMAETPEDHRGSRFLLPGHLDKMDPLR
jgi:hypothetical protein